MGNFAANVSDAELAEAIKASDHLAFKALYYRYFEALFRFLWRQTGNEELAKDLLQELFSRVWKSREQLDPQQPLKSYLYRIGHNLVIDHRRRVRPVDSLENHPEIEPSYSADESFDLHDKIQAAIEHLPEPVRLVFTMNRFDGIKYAEIAATLNISVKTVEARMSKALAILREKLAPFLVVLLFLLSINNYQFTIDNCELSIANCKRIGWRLKKAMTSDRVFAESLVVDYRKHKQTESANHES